MIKSLNIAFEIKYFTYKYIELIIFDKLLNKLLNLMIKSRITHF